MRRQLCQYLLSAAVLGTSWTVAFGQERPPLNSGSDPSRRALMQAEIKALRSTKPIQVRVTDTPRPSAEPASMRDAAPAPISPTSAGLPPVPVASPFPEPAAAPIPAAPIPAAAAITPQAHEPGPARNEELEAAAHRIAQLEQELAQLRKSLTAPVQPSQGHSHQGTPHPVAAPKGMTPNPAPRPTPASAPAAPAAAAPVASPFEHAAKPSPTAKRPAPKPAAPLSRPAAHETDAPEYDAPLAPTAASSSDPTEASVDIDVLPDAPLPKAPKATAPRLPADLPARPSRTASTGAPAPREMPGTPPAGASRVQASVRESVPVAPSATKTASSETSGAASNRLDRLRHEIATMKTGEDVPAQAPSTPIRGSGLPQNAPKPTAPRKPVASEKKTPPAASESKAQTVSAEKAVPVPAPPGGSSSTRPAPKTFPILDEGPKAKAPKSESPPPPPGIDEAMGKEKPASHTTSVTASIASTQTACPPAGASCAACPPQRPDTFVEAMQDGTVFDDAFGDFDGMSYATFEFLFIHPNFSTSSGVAIQTNAGANLTEQSFEHQFELAPRVTIGANSRDGFGWRFRFFTLDQAADLGVGPLAAGTTAFVPGPVPFTTVAGERLEEKHSVAIQTYDLEATHRLKFGKTIITAGAGVRFAEIEQRFDVQKFAGNVLNGAMNNDHDFHGFGPTIAAEWQRPISDGGLSFYANARGSVLFGSRDQTASAFGGGGIGVFHLDALDQDAHTAIGECGLGLQWATSNRGLVLRAGYEGQIWTDVGSAVTTQGNMGLQGLSALIGFSY